MRTLRQIRELYKPKSPDEQRFVDKHKVQKTPDANKNGDDVFNASKVKGVTRQPDHGYDPGDDEKVYEEVDQVDERCWKGYKPVPGKKPYSPGSCKKEEVEEIDEATKAPKNPHHIKTVEGAGRGMITITTNAGAKHTVSAKDTGGKMPSPGEHIGKYVKESNLDEGDVVQFPGKMKAEKKKPDTAPGWILRQDPELAKKFKDAEERAKRRKKFREDEAEQYNKEG